MKIPQLASLTATAALLLHFGNFVHANPMFVEINPNGHANDVSTSCERVRITYPAGEDLDFDNNTNHVVAWEVPSTFSHVNLTLVNDDSVSYLKSYPAQQGAANVPFVLGNGAKAGEYQIQLTTIGADTPCVVKSTPFQMNESPAKQQQTQQNEDVKKTEKHEDKQWDAMLTELGQYVDSDDDDEKEEKKHSQSHDNAVSEEQKTQSFESYIKSLDMQYKPYIANNRETESDVVTHKNSVDDDVEIPTATKHDDDKKYFTNEDHRTHSNDHLNAELDQLLGKQNGEHTDMPFFQGSGGEQSVKLGDDEDWVVEELPAPINQWFDESPDVKDHTNEGEWIAEEVDPSIQYHPNAGWDAEESDEPKAPFDHTDMGAWIAQEIENTPEKVTVEHMNDAPEGWIAEEDARHHNDDDIPDHSDVGQWQAEEIEFDHHDVADGWQEVDSKHPNAAGGWKEETSTHPNVAADGWKEETSTHPNKLVNGWQQTTSKHPNIVEGGWKEESSSHPNKVVDGWQETTSKHPNIVEGGWKEESSSHPNKVVNGWQETTSKHPNVVEGGWKEESSSHPNKVVNGWQETTSKHPNVVEGGWKEETSSHPNKVVDGWQETTSKHPNAVEGGWKEKTSSHPNKVVDGWQETTSRHPNQVVDGWQEESSSKTPVNKVENLHLDDNVLIYSAEELIN